MTKLIYKFGETKSDKNLLGGKGAGLNEMTRLGISIPSGFIITTEACTSYYKQGKKLSEELKKQIRKYVAELEKTTGKGFGDKKNPLLVSVRSGAAASMPGMMDTILNLGLNDEIVEGMVEITKNERFCYDCYRRFIQIFGDVVLGIKNELFEEAIDELKEKRKVKLDTDLTAEDLSGLVSKFKEIVRKQGKGFLQDPTEQLMMAVDAVFKSWNTERAVFYRKIHSIPDDLGTAVNVQTMVFGNAGEDSGTGVLFTRSPADGKDEIYGEFIMNAQGEDLVAGIRTPRPLAELEKINPGLYKELFEIAKQLEKHFKEMQDIEFTIEKGKLFILQTRNGKRTAHSAVKIAVDMEKEGLITKEEAIMRIEPESLNALLHKTIKQGTKKEVIATGLPASPGAATGEIVFTAQKAHDLAEDGKKVILVRKETSPEDIQGINAAQGIVTVRGGVTSHAAVVARGMGKPCVVGCETMRIDEKNNLLIASNKTLREGDKITIADGEVILGEAELEEPQLKGEFATLMEWADETRKIGVEANAETLRDAKTAFKFGAEGIGLCRTEHMFFGEERITPFREMILSETTEEREKALKKILPMQQKDFTEILNEAGGKPVTVRLLDPPLHEFLPQTEEDINKLAKEMGIDKKIIEQKSHALKEVNPMLGHRGCRLTITYPEIAEMQVTAVINAACELKKKGKNVHPEIMVPLVGNVTELTFIKGYIKKAAEKAMKKNKEKVNYKIGTMIEVPRSALTADEIAKEAEFFSLGTNDLTQMTYGFSRDDINKFLPSYKENKILKVDPFKTIDQEGVGQLIKTAVEKGKKANKKLVIGICGEHGGDAESVKFCRKAGLDYVSCSPFRVPIARLAAAQAEIELKNQK